jgi:hypothetical protein
MTIKIPDESINVVNLKFGHSAMSLRGIHFMYEIPAKIRRGGGNDPQDFI